jgi:hypothetical protein
MHVRSDVWDNPIARRILHLDVCKLCLDACIGIIVNFWMNHDENDDTTY